jgi:hypothetical protein
MSEGAQARGVDHSSLPGGELHPSASRDENASLADAAANASRAAGRELDRLSPSRIGPCTPEHPSVVGQSPCHAGRV